MSRDNRWELLPFAPGGNHGPCRKKNPVGKRIEEEEGKREFWGGEVWGFFFRIIYLQQ